MSERRPARFASEDEAIAAIARLRVGHTQHGNWTLAQIAWHSGFALRNHLAPPDEGVERTPEQEEIKKKFIDYAIRERKPPPHLGHAPPPMVPPATANASDIDQLESDLRQLKAYPHARVLMGPVGPLAIEEFREFNLLHLAHHLSFLEATSQHTAASDTGNTPVGATPASPSSALGANSGDAGVAATKYATNRPARRTGVQFADEDAANNEIERLRRGYVKAGHWSLAQVCFHLNESVKSRMQPGPFPPNTPEQDARRDQLQQILATGKLPDGIDAPPTMQPAPDCGDACIDAVIATLKKFKTFPGPIAPHRLFGHLSDADARKINLIHFAHHLSYLVAVDAV